MAPHALHPLTDCPRCLPTTTTARSHTSWAMRTLLAPAIRGVALSLILLEGSSLLLGCEVAVELYLALTTSPHAAWLQEGDGWEVLLDEVGSGGT